MFLKKILSVAALMLIAITANAQMPNIPVDKDVRIGKLDNGLTYYIRYNNWPEKRANFYIAQRVGSIQEEEEQRGLAHFLEHMCFNGTKNFPDNNVIRWCESIGVKFGADLNAYTSIDQTVYNIDNVPTTRQSALDSCLLILHDWAGELLLEPEEIDKERGVIHEEWRLRTSANSRMFERNLPKLYPGSKYGVRYPIGLMSVIDNFKYDALRQYYEKWYHPDNQAIIVVGDVDVDHVEAEIKRLFANKKNPDNEQPVVEEPVPDNDAPIVVIDKDKEQQYNIIQMMIKCDADKKEDKVSPMYLFGKYMVNAAISMVNSRLAEYAQKPDCPYIQAGVSYDQYIFAKTKDALNVVVLPKDGMYKEAFAAVVKEVRRAAEFGFTATEYQRYKADFMSNLDKTYSNKDKRTSVSFCNEYKEHFLDNEPIPSLDDYYQMMKAVVPQLPLEGGVNDVFKQLVKLDGKNMVIISFNNEKEGAEYPTEEGLLGAVKTATTEPVTAYVDNVKNEPLIANAPKAGKIKSEKANDKYDYKELTLSNGVKVVLKKTDFKKDQVILTATSRGGNSVLGLNDYANWNLFDDAIEASGLGNFSNNELEKALAGKVASMTMQLGTYRTTLNGSSTPNDVETMLQLLYLYFTNINKDQQSFDSMMKNVEVMLKNKSLSAEAAFSDSLNSVTTRHNSCFKPIEMSDLKNVNYDRILELAKQFTANAADYEFKIIGNFDEATIRPLIETYIASLPSKKKAVSKAKDIMTPYEGIVVNNFKRKQETPKAIGVIAWRTKNIPCSLENLVKTQIASDVLEMIYLKKIREEASAAYTVMAQGSHGINEFGTTTSLLGYCPMKPEKAQEAMDIMRNEVEAMAKTCDSDMVKKVKENMLKNHETSLKTNSYWLGAINMEREFGIDTHSNYNQIVEAQTPETISAFVAEILKAGNRAEIVMLPEE